MYIPSNTSLSPHLSNPSPGILFLATSRWPSLLALPSLRWRLLAALLLAICSLWTPLLCSRHCSQLSLRKSCRSAAQTHCLHPDYWTFHCDLTTLLILGRIPRAVELQLQLCVRIFQLPGGGGMWGIVSFLGKTLNFFLQKSYTFSHTCAHTPTHCIYVTPAYSA